MTIQIEWTDDAQKALEMCDDVKNPDWDKIHGTEYGPLPSQAIYAAHNKKVLNLPDFRSKIRENTETILYDLMDCVEEIKSEDREKQFTQDDLYAVNEALERSYAKYHNEKVRADRLKEELEGVSRLDHLIKAVFG